MKKSLQLLAVASLPAMTFGFAQNADAASTVTNRLSRPTEAFKFAPKSSYDLANGGKALSLNNVKAAKQKSQKLITKDDLQNALPSGYAVGYLDAPDGSTWYYVQDLEYTEEELEGGYATKKVISKYKFTIYDSNYEEVGTVSDDVVLGDNETGVSAIELGACVTQKFFNTDANYEVMVMIAANTPEYVNHVYTKVYSIGVEGAVDTIEGYYVNAINSGSYSEKFYLTFFDDTYLPSSEVYGTEASDSDSEVYTYHYDIYGPASWSSSKASILKTINIPYDNLEGYDATPFIGVVADSKPYFAVMKYEKPYFVNDAISYDSTTGEMTRDLTPNTDNSLIVDLYSVTYSNFSLVKTTKIPMELKDETGTVCSFYEIGLLNYADDVSFGTWTKDGNPTYIVAVEDYISNTDESEYSFYAYDVDGNKVADIATEASALVDMSDLPGYEHQQGFYKVIDGVESFQFVDLPSCRIVATFPVALEDGNSLTASADRLATSNGYQYAFSLGYGITDDDDNTSHYIAWYNSDGTFDHNEIIPLGTQVAMALPYIKTSVLTPYLFNTDSKREYMFLLKKYKSDSGTATEESLVILNTDGDVLAQLTDDETLGSLSSITLMNANDDPALWIIYYNSDNDLYTSSFLHLPFTKFEKGGDGSASNPFLISSVGDLQQMKGNLTASYKLANDIDASGYDFSPVGEVFKGTLDGANHTISNLSLINDSYNNALFQQISGKAVVKDLNFKNATVVVGSENSSVALVAASATGDEKGSPSIENVHVDGYTALADNASYATFGGLVGRMAISATLKNSSISGANIDLTEDGTSNVTALGGLATQIMTGSNVENCSFQGYIAGGSSIGGIVSKLNVTGVSSTGQEYIANCHVNADIEGENGIGGIVGYAGRAPIYNNYVEGTIKATKNETWGGGAKTAGIVGELAEDWTGTGAKVVYNNVVALTSISVPEVTSESYLNQATTSHRIVGYTSYNAEPDVTGYDDNWEPIYSDQPNAADAGIQSNYAVGDLAVVDSKIEAGENTTEGATLAAADFTEEFVTAQGFKLGEDASNPWKFADANLSLYFEEATSGVADLVVNAANLHKTSDAFVADGCKLTVYNLYGVKVAAAVDAVSTRNLAPGVYVVSATANGKIVSTAKFIVK
jgi:hypothetical protein